jgi:O-antigen/teichoic acid export membrane protein
MVQAIILGMASMANYSFVYFIPTVSKVVSEDQHYFINLWNLILYTRTLLSILLVILSITIVYLFYPQFSVLWLFSLTLLIPKIMSPILFCNALETNQYVFRIGFLSKFLFLILILLSNEIELVNFFLAFSELIAILWYLKKIHSGFYEFKLVTFSELKLFLKETLHLFFVNIFSMLKPHSILPIIGYMFGNTYVTLFAISEKVINSIKGISGIMFVSFFPIYNKDDIKLNVNSLKVLISVLLLSIFIIVCFWYLSPYIIYYLNDFNVNDLAVKTLQILSLSIPMFFLIIPLFSYLLNHKKWNVILNIAIVQLVVLCVCLYIFSKENIIGVAKSLVFSEYVLLIFYTFYCYKTYRKNK